ncbi:hypothetical protein [Planosporangium mesophilum]|uniref:Uncharacterized protein n=1 Tax=Planosporangium mesophilum TaxID=689768 RepID=A0A8J3X3H7_9ACTN|nr:hypothetical protein [Planosporangium mesophilum]NJC82509.1 hypothetical protein [Planosporangium mesophilum]GII25489.1 hypothetical protein Pme01_50860 [Planosporangium mesophilum]
MSYRQTFMEDVRRQLAAETESDAIRRVRFFGAGLSIPFGLIGIAGFLAMAQADMPWAAAPGCLVMLAGGVLGICSQRKADVWSSRRLGAWAASCTVVGFLEYFLVNWLT